MQNSASKVWRIRSVANLIAYNFRGTLFPSRHSGFESSKLHAESFPIPLSLALTSYPTASWNISFQNELHFILLSARGNERKFPWAPYVFIKRHYIWLESHDISSKKVLWIFL